jgi:hydrogenase nickel incorporation protein HypA/HybF
MHEMSICQSLVTNLEDIAAREQVAKITRVRLEVGCFAGVEPQALHFGYDVTTKGTVAENSVLEIIDVAGQGWCFDCSDHFEVYRRGGDCPKCGGARINVTGGDELKIKDVEVE